MRSFRPIRLRLATVDVARVQAYVTHVVLVQQPGQEALDAQSVAAVRACAVLALVGEPVVRLGIDALALVTRQELVLPIKERACTSNGALRELITYSYDRSIDGPEQARTRFHILIEPPTISPTPGMSRSTDSVSRGSSAQRGM